MATSGSNLSRDFFELLKAIGESKSKQEEDRIIQREVMVLKKKLESPNSSSSSSGGGGSAKSVVGAALRPNQRNDLLSSKKKSKEFLVRLLYVEMLGHDGAFGYIKAVELAASSSIAHKRVGYLVCGSCLPPEHEFRFMLVNQMQRDLNSSHVLESCAALSAVTRIITPDMVPAISADVMKLLAHANETVRKKAILALHRFHQIAPECVTAPELSEKLRRVLCDRDPSVMGASLNAIRDAASKDPGPYKDLVPSLVSILKQILEHRLPSDFDYHRVPAPWMQMHVVRVLAVLGRNDAAASEGMYEILGECMRRADVGINVGFAVQYECVRCVTTIYPNPRLLDAAADDIARFVSSRSQNLRYLGVTGLAAIVERHPQYAAAHQLAVIECLEDRDDTLQRKTLDLLYRMTNPVNVEFITRKLLEFLKGTTDPFLRKSLTGRICTVAERYAPSNGWYVRVVTELMEIAGDHVEDAVAQNLMSLVAEGGGGGEEDEEADQRLRVETVNLYADLLDRPKLPRVLAESVAWVLGEYAYLGSADVTEVLERLCAVMRRRATEAPSTRRCTAAAVMKLVAQAGTCPPAAARVVDDLTKSRDLDLQQRALEFQSLLTDSSHVLGEVLPVDASCEDLEADEELRFLDGYVQEALRNGAAPYAPPEDDDDDDDDHGSSNGAAAPAFNFTAYEKPTRPTASVGYLGSAGGGGGAASTTPTYSANGVPLPPGANEGASSSAPPAAVPTGEPELVLRNVANVWGKGGMTGAPAATPPPAAAPSIATAAPVLPTAASSSPYRASSSSSASPWGSSYGAAESRAPAPAPVKTAEQLEKERMAAALFGGIVPGAAAAPPPAEEPREPVAAPPPPPPRPVATPAPAPPPPAPAPAPPTMDLLDFSDPAPAPAPEPAAVAPSLADVLDPFSSSSAAVASVFSHRGVDLAPLPYTTPQFGGAWGGLPHTAPTSASATLDLSALMDRLAAVGLATVEVIPTTSEGIAAGQWGDGDDGIVLVHGKIDGARADVTVKSRDAELGSALAAFLGERLRG